METARQRLETKDLQGWVERTQQVLSSARDLLNDLNTFPVPNFNTGSNLAASWELASRASSRLSPSLRPGEFMGILGREIAKYPHGSVGMFLAAAFIAVSKAWEGLTVIRPADLLMAADRIETTFHNLDGENPLEFGLTSLAGNVSSQLAELELLTLTQVSDTALVCAQEATVESADAHGGVGDAGLAGMCLILASLADLASLAEGESQSKVATVESMLDEWANRSRVVSEAMRHSMPGGEFGATFHFAAVQSGDSPLHQALQASCSEILVLKVSDEIGAGRFVAHVHTASPLAALPHPHGTVLIRHLNPRSDFITPEEDPLSELASGFDNVVVLSDFAAQRSPLVPPQLLVLTQAPALVETLARTGATLLLEPQETSQVLWALKDFAPDRAALIIPASPSFADMATAAATMMTAEKPQVMVADTADELSAAFLLQFMQGRRFRGNLQQQLSAIKTTCREFHAGIHVETVTPETLESQVRNLVQELPENPEIKELYALLGSAHANSDRMNLQLMLTAYEGVELVATYGGQPGPTIIGVHR